MFEVSVVIPTRNRLNSLTNLLAQLNLQSYPLKEVIIVDSSDSKIDLKDLKEQNPKLNIHCLYTTPSVCRQRNLGIEKAKADYVFICDDDIEINVDYIYLLMQYARNNPKIGVVSGLILQSINGSWEYQYPPKSFKNLLYAYIFQLPIWGDVHKLKVKSFQKGWYNLILRFYKKRENGLSKAGWPIMTNFSNEVIPCTTYGLGASIIKKDWLIKSKYDESLDEHGIGDNYGLVLDFPEVQSVRVLRYCKALHALSDINRLDASTTYYRRVMALNHFLPKVPGYTYKMRLWLFWSLIGNAISFLLKGKWAFLWRNFKLMSVIVFKIEKKKH